MTVISEPIQNIITPVITSVISAELFGGITSWWVTEFPAVPLWAADFTQSLGMVSGVETALTDMLTEARNSTQIVENADGTLTGVAALALPISDLGLAPWEARENLYLHSDISGASWTVAGGGGSITVTPGYDDGLGGTTACRLQIDATAASSFPRVLASVSGLSTIANSTVSFRVKSFDGTPQKVGIYDVRAGQGFYDVGAEWATIYKANTPVSSTTNPGLMLRNGSNPTEVCDILVAFAQCENETSFPGPRIVTDGATATRVASDITAASMSWFGNFGTNLYTGQAWTAAAGVTETATHLQFTGSNTGFHPQIVNLGFTTDIGTKFLVHFEVTAYTSGTLTLYVGDDFNAISGVSASSTGVFSGVVEIVDPTDDRIHFHTTDFIGDVLLSSIVVQELDATAADIMENGFVVLAEVNPKTVGHGKNRHISALTDATDETDHRAVVILSPADSFQFYAEEGPIQYNDTFGSAVADTVTRVGMYLAPDDAVSYVGGVSGTPDAIVDMPTGIDTFRIGRPVTPSLQFNGFIRKLAIIPASSVSQAAIETWTAG